MRLPSRCHLKVTLGLEDLPRVGSLAGRSAPSSPERCSMPPTNGTGSPRGCDLRHSEEEVGLLLPPQKGHTITSIFYLLEANHWIQPRLTGRGMKRHLLEGRVSKNLWIDFKTTTDAKALFPYLLTTVPSIFFKFIFLNQQDKYLSSIQAKN